MCLTEPRQLTRYAGVHLRWSWTIAPDTELISSLLPKRLLNHQKLQRVRLSLQSNQQVLCAEVATA